MCNLDGECPLLSSLSSGVTADRSMSVGVGANPLSLSSFLPLPTNADVARCNMLKEGDLAFGFRSPLPGSVGEDFNSGRRSLGGVCGAGFDKVPSRLRGTIMGCSRGVDVVVGRPFVSGVGDTLGSALPRSAPEGEGSRSWVVFSGEAVNNLDVNLDGDGGSPAFLLEDDTGAPRSRSTNVKLGFGGGIAIGLSLKVTNDSLLSSRPSCFKASLVALAFRLSSLA